LNLRHSFAEGHAGKLCLQTPALGGIGGGAQSVRQVKKKGGVRFPLPPTPLE